MPYPAFDSRRACRPRVALAAAVGCLGLAAPTPAAASDPVSTYVVPAAVEQPAGSPARVIIHGAFFQLTSTTSMTYGDPRCGVMYFQCQAGQEAMCRMQWDELAAAISSAPTLCQGFGSLNVLSTAAIHDEGAELGTPAPWDLGIGIGMGVYVDGKCTPARALVCPPAGAPDAGAADGPAVPDAGGAVDVNPVVDVAPPVDTAPVDAAPIIDTAPAIDAANDKTKETLPTPSTKHGGCAVAAHAPAGVLPASLALVLLLGSAIARRRRR